MNITAKYVTKVFENGEVYALNGFTARFGHGSIVSVLGESGCGKTTLLRVLSGLEKPTSGELYFDGVLYKDVPIKERDTAVVFQEYVLYPKMTVWENVAVALERYGLPREEEEDRIRRVLKELDLLKFKNQLPRVLSGGQQQRVALARAIVRDPSLILFDEPLSNVAEEQRSEYLTLILKLKTKHPQTTFVYVTHNAKEAFTIGDCLLIMDDGKNMQFGEKERVWKYPYTADVLRALVGEPIEYVGKMDKGIFTYDGGEIDFSGKTDHSGNATVIYNPYNFDEPHAFDENGRTLFGERETCLFDGVFDGNKLSFCGLEIAVDADFKQRFTGAFGKVKVGVISTDIGFKPNVNDIKLSAEKCAEPDAYAVGGRKITVYGGKEFDGNIYFSPDGIELFDTSGERILAHYRVYGESVEGKLKGDRLKLPCGCMYGVKSDFEGDVGVTFKPTARISKGKNGMRAFVLDEEVVGKDRLVYCTLKGFEHYVVFRADRNEHFLGVKKLKIIVDPSGVDLRPRHY